MGKLLESGLLSVLACGIGSAQSGEPEKLSNTSALSVFSLLNRAVENSCAVPNLTHFHVGINYDLMGAVARTGLY